MLPFIKTSIVSPSITRTTLALYFLPNSKITGVGGGVGIFVGVGIGVNARVMFGGVLRVVTGVMGSCLGVVVIVVVAGEATVKGVLVVTGAGGPCTFG